MASWCSTCKRGWRPMVLAAAATVLLCGTPPPAPAAPAAQSSVRAKKGRLALKRITKDFDAPTHLAAPRGERGTLYVTEQGGRVWKLRAGERLARPFLDISGQVGTEPEQGLFSIAFHPDYATNRRLYVNYTDARGNTRVAEYRSNDKRALKRSARQILWIRQNLPNHNGGQIAFGPRGGLFVAMGDGGGPADPGGNGQNDRSPLGSLLRVDVDREGSPWGTVGYGLRNPWRFSFDSQTGDLYVSDVGQEAVEEINFTPRRSPGVENYGWSAYEGHARFSETPVNPRGRLVMPIVSYSHALGCSVTGGHVYRGERLPATRGRYFYGDFCTGHVWSMRVREGEATSHRRERFRVPQLVSFGEDGSGELYLLSRGGTVFKLVSR